MIKNAQTHVQALLNSFGKCRIGDAGRAHPDIRRSIDLGKSSPTQDTLLASEVGFLILRV